MNTSFFIGMAMLIYIGASIVYMVFAITNSRTTHLLAMAAAAIAFILHSAALTTRTIETGRLPLTNTYETLLLFSWVLALLTFWWQSRYEIRILPVFTLPVVFLSLAAASLPQISSEVLPLLPSLRSNWLLAHVMTCFIAYACFGLAFASAMMDLLSERLLRLGMRVSNPGVFDNVTYRAIRIGYPLLTLGIVTGAIWANSCWGRYWGWDPKETWSLITWIIYSVFLHLRYTGGWKNRWSSWAAVVGFISVIFTYLGVNYLFTGLHSYV